MKRLFFIFLIVFTSLMSAQSQNWESLNSSTDYILFDISFPPGQNQVGYAAGMQYTWDAEGVIVKTTDGGDTWQQIVGGENTPGFEAICFTSEEVGYIGGWDGYFAKTIDGGNTWTNMDAGSNNWFFMDIEFYDEYQGIALANLNSGSSGIYRTSNAGQNWTLSTELQNSIQDISYANSSSIFAVGSDESIYQSNNGGYTWELNYSGLADRYFLGVDFNGHFGVVGGEDGKIFYTTNNGANWSTYATGYLNFQGIYVFETDSAYIGGTDEDIYKSLDDGNNWEMEENGTGSSHIYKITFLDDGTGFLCGSQGMIKRKQSFVEMQADFSGDTEACNWQQVHFQDETFGFVETWEWTFEGPASYYSSEQNPSITLSTPGVYDVTLKVSGYGQQDSITKEAYYESHLCPGLSENTNHLITVFPNPASNTLYLKGIAKEVQIRIFDLIGKEVFSCKSNSQLDISHLPEGSYLIEISSGELSLQQKLIINR